MTLRFSSKQWKIMIFCLIVLVTMYAGFYTLIFSPLQDQVEQKKLALSTEEQLIQVQSEKLANQQEAAVTNTITLQQRVPTEPLVELLLLDLEKAEAVSDSRITSMMFTEEAFEEEISSLEEYENLTDDKKELAEQINSETEESIGTQETVIEEESSLGVKELVVQLNIEASNYFEMKKFLDKIESLERVTRIKTLHFTGYQEVTTLQEMIPTLTFTVELSAYYYPNLPELQADLPKLQTPKPANKLNPFAGHTYSNDEEVETAAETSVLSETVENPDYTIKEIDGKTYKIYEHKVKEGDTLFDISLFYYGSRSGEELIKNYNNISSTVYKGSFLYIPVPQSIE